MSGAVLLLNLAGAVALLLWATRMVRSAVEKAYGDRLKQRLRSTLRQPLLALGAGGMLAVALQSSTAVVLLVSSFVASSTIAGPAGLLAVLGADVGSSLVVKLLSFNLGLLVPICLVLGTAIFMSTERTAWREVGRIVVGLGLLLLSLRLIGEASGPLRESRIFPVVVDYLAGDPATAFLLAALVTWLFHSSVAAILLVAALAARGVLPFDVGLVFVLGANLGAGIVGAVLSRASEPQARTVPFCNLLFRGVAAIGALIAIIAFEPPLAWLGQDDASRLVHAHIAFNVALALIGLVLARPAYALVERLQAVARRNPGQELAAAEISALDEHVLGVPGQALANATREAVRVCETIELMLQQIIELYAEPDRDKIEALAALDDRVDRRHAAIKLYLAKIEADRMSRDDQARHHELLGACIRLEQVGDIIVRNMLAHVRKKMDRGLQFTEQGWSELTTFHQVVLSNARLAFNVLISRNPEIARRLIEEKDRLRDLEKKSSQNHFSRLQEGTAKSLETSSIHLDTIRDLKQINSLLAAVAYPVLEEQGLLRQSRLKRA